MKQFINNTLKVVMSILITTIIVGSVSVYAITKYLASDINFTPSNENFKKENGEAITNVEEALNELYNKSNNSCYGSFVGSDTSETIIDCGFKPNKVLLYVLASNDHIYIYDYEDGIFYTTESTKGQLRFIKWNPGIKILDDGFSYKAFDYSYNYITYYVASK